MSDWCDGCTVQSSRTCPASAFFSKRSTGCLVLVGECLKNPEIAQDLLRLRGTDQSQKEALRLRSIQVYGATLGLVGHASLVQPPGSVIQVKGTG